MLPRFNKITASFSLVGILAGILLLSMQSGWNVNAETKKIFSGHENHSITPKDAGILTRAYKESVPSGAILAEFFGRDAIQGILDQPTCVGIRMYFAKKADGAMALVLVGADASGKDLSRGPMAEFGMPCPPICPVQDEVTP